jgi:hypothetical protein
MRVVAGSDKGKEPIESGEDAEEEQKSASFDQPSRGVFRLQPANKVGPGFTIGLFPLVPRD